MGLFAEVHERDQARQAADAEKFARQHARSTDAASSKRAAGRLAPRAASQCGKLLDILRRGPIRNQALLVEAAQAGITNYRARVSDLRGWGCVVEVDDDGVYRLTKDLS